MPRAIPILLSVAGSALTIYLLVLAWLWLRQEQLLFFPEPLPAHHRLATEPDIHEVTVDVDGAQLSVLHLKLPAPKGVVFFLHGNGGNLASWFTNAAFYRAANYDLVMPDYRGYGKSTGRIASAAELRRDVRAVWDRLGAPYQDRKVVLYGRSLGTGLAADLAAQLTAEGRAPDLTVLVSPYTSLADLTAEFYPWVPGLLLRYPLETVTPLQQVRGRILLLHGAEDRLIRPLHAQRLHQRVPQAQLVVVPGADHNDLHESAAYRDAFARALAEP